MSSSEHKGYKIKRWIRALWCMLLHGEILRYISVYANTYLSYSCLSFFVWRLWWDIFYWMISRNQSSKQTLYQLLCYIYLRKQIVFSYHPDKRKRKHDVEIFNINCLLSFGVFISWSKNYSLILIALLLFWK